MSKFLQTVQVAAGKNEDGEREFHLSFVFQNRVILAKVPWEKHINITLKRETPMEDFATGLELLAAEVRRQAAGQDKPDLKVIG